MAKVVSTNATVRKDLKTVPPDGYVILKRLQYGQKLDTQGFNKIQFEAERIKGSRTAQNMKAQMSAANKESVHFTWGECIVEHNLHDENDVKFDFKNPADIDRLPQHVGEEIDMYLDELNNFEGDSGNLSNGSMEESSSTVKT